MNRQKQTSFQLLPELSHHSIKTGKGFQPKGKMLVINAHQTQYVQDSQPQTRQPQNLDQIADKKRLSGYEEFKKFRATNTHLKSYQNLEPFQPPERSKFHLESIAKRLTQNNSPFKGTLALTKKPSHDSNHSSFSVERATAKSALSFVKLSNLDFAETKTVRME